MIYDTILGSFDFGKDARSKEISEMTYKDIWLNTIASMFKYTGFENEKHFRPQFMELYLLIFGQCAIWKLNDNLIVTVCNRAGSPNENGQGKDLICTTLNGISKTFNNFEDSNEVVFVQNNTVIAPDLNIERFSNMFAEIDKSIYNNIINSRYSPIVVAKDENTKKIIEAALDNNNSGKPQTIASSNILDENGEYVLNITDVTASDKLQYLMKAHDDLNRRMYTLYGMNIMGSGKMAQLTRAEVNDGSESSMIIPYDRLYWREKAIEQVNEYFNLEAKVEFSEPWKLAFDDIILYNLEAKEDKTKSLTDDFESNIENVDTDEEKISNDLVERKDEE